MNAKLFSSRTLGLALFIGTVSCGGSSIDMPESLTNLSYPADTPVRMTFIMTSCSDLCSDYDESDCSFDINADDMEIDIDVSVSYSDRDGIDRVSCSLTCGAPVLGHCDIDGIPPGRWTVRSGTFSQQVESLDCDGEQADAVRCAQLSGQGGG